MKFFSRGKLLISGEYLVLNGALALAVPLKKGQELRVAIAGKPGELTWESREYGKPWFKVTFRTPFFEIIETSDESLAENLVRHFKAIVQQQPAFAGKISGASVVTDLDFNRQWGFGSSSSLLSNLAYWADIDPFRLHQRISAGSGYDVVCAREEGPVFFNLTETGYKTEEATLNQAVTRYLYFVYMGKKSVSSRHVSDFLGKHQGHEIEKQRVTEIGKRMAAAANIEDFETLMKEHEQVIAPLLQRTTLKEGIFSDLPGEAKSLGAWGGDFAMITWTGSRNDLLNYLNRKKLNTFFSYDELVKTR